MSGKRVSMRKIREVLRLTYELRLSVREVRAATGIGKTAVSEYVRRAKVIGITWPIPDALDDAALERRLFDLPGESARPGRVMPDWVGVHDELKRRGVTLEILWSEYRAVCADGIGYTQFCWHFSEWRKRLSPVMRQTYVAGDKLFVDWAGDTVPVTDVAGGGVERRAHLFVAVLGASSFTFACATWTETLPDWIGCHVAALDFIGGVPKSTVPDNLKTGITTPSRYEPGVNRTYQEFADHYGFVVLPARPYKPRDKAKVEAAVRIVERYILGRLRNRRFLSLDDLNDAIAQCVADINAKVMRRIGKSRTDLFHALDEPILRQLPATHFEYAEWKRATVAQDYHIAVDDHFYSVPWRLLREMVDVRVTAATIEVLHKGRRVAAHMRSSEKPISRRLSTRRSSVVKLSRQFQNGPGASDVSARAPPRSRYSPRCVARMSRWLLMIRSETAGSSFTRTGYPLRRGP